MHPKSIRAFRRGLDVLAALNHQGSASALELARSTNLSRPTVYRLIQTLVEAGYVARGADDDKFHLRRTVRKLAGGFKDEQWVADVAAPLLIALTARIAWPCDVLTLDGLSMVIRDTTHSQAPLSIDRNMVGRHTPLLASAAGLAYMAFAPESERKLLLDLLAQSAAPADAMARDPARAERLIAASQRRGFGLRQGGPIWPHTGAVALPIRHNGRVLGCISTIWMARVMSHADGVRRCLAPLRETQACIEQELGAR